MLLPPPLPARQHLKSAGPGQSPDSEDPEHCDVKRQFPPDPQDGLTQHLISVGSLGQNPDLKLPPAPLQLAVEMQTPGVLLIVQGPLTVARVVLVARSKMEKTWRMDMIVLMGR